MDSEKEAALAELIAAVAEAKNSAAYSMVMHNLADARYEPAKSLFVRLLSDTREDWRYDAVTSLGFHYSLGSDDLESIRQLARVDPVELIRSAAVRVLEHQRSWPDKTLLYALDNDVSHSVRSAAFMAILRLMNYPIAKYLSTLNMLRAGSLIPTRQQLRTLLEAENISFSDDELQT